MLEADPLQLAALAHDLARAGIPHAPIIESDQPYENQLVALGIDPRVDRRALRRYLSSLPLMGKEVRAKAV